MNERLISLLDSDLDSSFEDNIIMKYADFILPVGQCVDDPRECRAIMQRYQRARAAYLNAVADLIQNPDVLD